MRVAFPHMGNLYIPLTSLLENLGCEVKLPPRPSRKSIELGVKYSPEWMCFPYKANLGDLILALQNGADTLLSVKGDWACRFGYYGRLHHKTLRDMGFKFESIIIGKNSVMYVINKVKKLKKGSLTKTILHMIRGFWMCWKKSKLVDLTERLARKYRPYAKNKKDVERVLNKCLRWIYKEKTLSGLDRLRKKIIKEFEKIECDWGKEVLKVKLVGETYIVIEPAVNFDIERRLGEMGVYVEPFLTIHKWIWHPFHIGLGGKRGERAARRVARKYLKHCIGGEEQLSIGYTIFAAKDGFDGVIHLYPFTCMTENVAKEILPKLQKEYNIPVMSITIDEHTGEAGFISRIEAFVDLLKARRKNANTGSRC